MHVSMRGVIQDDLSSGGDFTFHRGHIMLIRTWLLLYSQSTSNMLCNQKLLKNIRKSNGYITIHCNAVSKPVEIIGDLLGYRIVWFDRSAIASILSLSRATHCFHAQFENWNGNHFSLSTLSHTVIFQYIHFGIYYHDTEHWSVMLINTVAEDCEGFTNREFEGAQATRRSLGMLVFPSEQDFGKMVHSNLIHNYPITLTNIANAKKVRTFPQSKASLSNPPPPSSTQ